MGQGDMTEVYQRLGKIETMVARIDERTNSASNARIEFREDLNDHDNRIRALEDKESKRAGFIAAVVAIASALSGLAAFCAGRIGGKL